MTFGLCKILGLLRLGCHVPRLVRLDLLFVCQASEPMSDFLLELEKAVETLPMSDFNFPDLLTWVSVFDGDDRIDD
jgi:hypothetical protein